MNHVALEVGDIEASVEFYRSLLSAPLRGKSDTSAFLDMGDQFLALSQTDATDDSEDGHRHVGLVVDDMEKLNDRFAAIGIDQLDVPGTEIHDPWGNRIQFVEYRDVQFTKADHVLAGMGLTQLEKSEEAIGELADKDMDPSHHS